jgi:hypothetical protein
MNESQNGHDVATDSMWDCEEHPRSGESPIDGKLSRMSGLIY